MGKINRCLKAVFIAFNCLFTCLGALLIYGLVQTIGIEHQIGGMDAPSMIWFWVFAIGILGISLLGSHAGRTENKCCLKVFAVFMGLGMFLMVIFGVVVVILKNQAIESIQSPEVAKEVMKNDHTREMLEIWQKKLQCCGWTGVEDWGTDIPDSCSCSPSYGSQGHAECKPVTQRFTGLSQVYSKSCGKVLEDYVEYGLKIVLGILFGFAITAMMGLIISTIMINQISRHDRGGVPAMALRAF